MVLVSRYDPEGVGRLVALSGTARGLAIDWGPSRGGQHRKRRHPMGP